MNSDTLSAKADADLARIAETALQYWGLARAEIPLSATRHFASTVAVQSVRYSSTVIGEAAKNTSAPCKAAHPDIPWRAIASTRDKIIPEYFRTNPRRIWDVVTDDIDMLEDALRSPTIDPSAP